MAVWRQMRRSGALPLGQGTWALADDVEGQGQADLLEELIRRRHGHVLRFDVPDSDPRLADVDAIVHLTVDREWQRLLAAIENARVELLGATDPVLASTRLEDLRRSYAETLEREPRVESMATGVATRLSNLVRTLPRELLSSASGAGSLPRAELRSRTGLRHGPHRVCVEPFPGYGWELDFHEFERTAYTPSPSRPDVQHGVVTLLCDVDEIPAQIAAIDRRVELFSYLDAPNRSFDKAHASLAQLLP